MLNPIKTKTVLEWAERNYQDTKNDDYKNSIEINDALNKFNQALALHNKACESFLESCCD